jgi:trigger factor
MKLEVTELGPVKRAFKIEVPSEEVNRHFSQAYAELSRQVHIPGFRPGKAPRALLEQRYAKAVEEDLVRRLIPDYYGKAVREAGVVPVQVEVPPLERLKIKKDSAFSFTATVEIKPKIELRDYRAPNPISLKKDSRTVTEEQLAQTLEALREQQAQLDAAPEGKPLAEGDFAVLDIQGYLNGAALEHAKQDGQVHRVGSKGLVLGLEVDPHLLGKKSGETVEIVQPYPVTHPDATLAGKSVGFRVTVKAVKHKRLPTLDDEFAKDCGPYNSLDELKEKLRGEMDQALQRDIEAGYKDQVIKRLQDTHHFDLPESMVERELQALVRRHFEAERRRKGKGGQDTGPADQAGEVTRLRAEHAEEAKRRVKLSLILEAIADKEGLTVTQEDLETDIRRMAAELKLNIEDVQRLIQAGGQDALDDLRSRILAEKALEYVYRQAMIQG